jgi:RNA polymerase sigma factor (sigma-70 family)
VTLRKVPSSNERQVRFRVLYERSYGPVSSYVQRRLPRGDASGSDLVAEVFMVAWRRMDDIPAAPQDVPWLIGVARNIALNHFRRAQRSRSLLERLSIEESRLEVESAGASDIELRVQRLISTFSELDREIFRLIHWEELSHDEVAVVVGITSKAVERRIARTRARVRALVTPNTYSITPISTNHSNQSNRIDLRFNERNIS